MLLFLLALALQGPESLLPEPEGSILTGLWDGRVVRLLDETRMQHVATPGNATPVRLHIQYYLKELLQSSTRENLSSWRLAWEPPPPAFLPELSLT